MNVLRATMPDGTLVLECLIETGSRRSARRVPAALAQQIPSNATIMVETSRGWEQRYLVCTKGVYYTRATPPQVTATSGDSR
jgi:hypothetical protein